MSDALAEEWGVAIAVAQEAYGLTHWTFRALVVEEILDGKGKPCQAYYMRMGKQWATVRLSRRDHWLPVLTLAYHELYHALHDDCRGREEALACRVSMALERVRKFRET